MQRYRTQSLVLEFSNYDTDTAIFTIKDKDYEYEGKTFYSLKRLYMLANDPTEYDFAMTYLYNWQHWQRLCENKLFTPHIEEWRNELELRLRCQGVKAMMLSAENGNYQASKWLVDRGWENRGAGRPTKLEKEQHLAQNKAIENDFAEDYQRMLKVVNK